MVTPDFAVAPQSASNEPAIAAPVREWARVTAIDAARGFALLGILLVNIQSFAEPFGRFLEPRPESSDMLTQFLYYLVKIFAEGKFYPLFSMLFGMGLVLQMGSVEAAGQRFRPLYLRRLFVLLVIGLLHALLLWYGDILFIYALAGLVLMLCSRLSGKTLLTIGVVMLVAVSVVGGAVVGFMSHSTAEKNAAAATAPPQAAQEKAPDPNRPDGLDKLAENSPFFTLWNGFRDEKIDSGPDHPLWIELEQRAYHDGPWFESFAFRVITWLFYLVFCLFGFGWSVLAMFFIGAGLLRLGLFKPEHRRWRVRLALLGLLVGVPGAIVAGVAPGQSTSLPVMLLAGLCAFGLSPLVSLMYLCTISLIAESGLARGVVRTLAAVGRMALTNYLTHTLVCTFIFYHWGLAQFGEWSRPERVLLVLTIFGAQCVISPLYLSRFRFGPMEWLWRSLTYGRAQPMRREQAVFNPH